MPTKTGSKSGGTRRKARELALSALYMLDLQSKSLSADEESEAIERFFMERETSEDALPYARKLVTGVRTNIGRIDPVITSACEHWKLKRIAPIDRNILRISALEILMGDDVPPQVSIDEAVEIARKYGSEESAKFVNGVLDRILKDKSKL